MELIEKKLSGETIYDGKIISLVKDNVLLPNGETSIREVVEHHGGATAVALTEEKEIFLVRQFRYPNRHVILETPAGKLEKGEEPFEAIKRELKEEIGVESGKYYFLGTFNPTPAYCSEIIYLYLVTDLKMGEQKLDADEFLNVEKVPLEKAVQMVLDGEITDGKSQALILKTFMLLEQGSIHQFEILNN